MNSLGSMRSPCLSLPIPSKPKTLFSVGRYNKEHTLTPLRRFLTELANNRVLGGAAPLMAQLQDAKLQDAKDSMCCGSAAVCWHLCAGNAGSACYKMQNTQPVGAKP